MEEAVEALGVGWFQVRLWVITGLFGVSSGRIDYIHTSMCVKDCTLKEPYHDT